MSSIFGTFRRTKKKNSIDQSSTLGQTSSVFSSTPNLLKIDKLNVNVKNHTSSGAVPVSPLALSSSNGEKSVGVSLDKYDVAEKRSSFASRRTSSAQVVMSSPSDKHGQGSSPNPFQKKGSNSSMRSFMSMMNVMGSLKRSKSVRKLGWGSTANVSSNATSTSTPLSSSSRKHRKSVTSNNSRSEEFLDQDHDIDLDLDAHTQSNKNRNTEPGVASSSSDSSSENNSVADTDASSIRGSSERSSSQSQFFRGEDFVDEDMDEVLAHNKDPAEIERNKDILGGTKKFNMDPKKGIEFLVEKGVILYTPEGVARFLKEGYGLSKGSIGNYLGERNDFNESVLKCFVELHDFKDLILVQALRQFLWGFRLPGESQKINRMLDAFAERYCANNPHLFSADTCSVLCYSIIMLNTELHNPNVKEKATLDQFTKRNRGIEGGEFFTTQFMASLYNSILTEPFRFPEEDGNDLMLTFFNPDYEGWLYKFGGRPKSWKRLWFILSNNCLYYFKFTTDKTPRGIIPLENILVRVPPERPSSNKMWVLVLYKDSPDPRIVDYIKTCKTLSNGATAPRQYPTIQLGTHDPKMRERWVRAINANHSMSNFYSDLTLRKMKAKIQAENRKAGITTGVRKSQIGLPSTVNGNSGHVLPSVALQDPNKDPNNFFVTKNLSSISLHSPGEAAAAAGTLGFTNSPGPRRPSISIEGGHNQGVRNRSRSESRLYEGRRQFFGAMQSHTATTTVLPLPPAQRSNSKSPVLRHKIRHHPPVQYGEDTNLKITRTPLFLTSQQSTSTDTEPEPEPEVQVQRRRPEKNLTAAAPITTIFDKYKKLSMINELHDAGAKSGSFSSDLDEDFKITLEASRVSTSSSGTDDTEFEYKMLKEEEASLSLIEDHNHNHEHDPQSKLISLKSEDSLETLLDNSNSGDENSLINLSSSSQCDSQVPLPLIRNENDNLEENENCDIQIIDCSQPQIQIRLFTSEGNNNYVDDNKNEITSISTTNSEPLTSSNRNIPQMYFDSIYESNV